jgi:hypothetical protein
VTVLSRQAIEFLIEGMRSNFPHQISCDICGEPLDDDRREIMHGPFPICVHAGCRDLYLSRQLDKRKCR